MPDPAQYEPDDQRLRPLTSADTVWWQAAEFAIKNRVPLAIAAGIIIAAAIGFSMWSSAREGERVASGAAIYSAKEAKDYEAVIQQWPGSNAAAQALIFLADEHYQRGEYVKAGEVYKRFLAEFPMHLLAGGAQLGLAQTLEAQGNFPAAINAYKDLQGRYPDSHHVTEAQMGLGRCYEFQSEWDKAKLTYESVINSGSRWEGHAKDRLIIVNRQLKAAATKSAVASPPAAPAQPPPAEAPKPAPADIPAVK